MFVLGPERCLLLPYCLFRCSDPTLELAAIIPSPAKDGGVPELLAAVVRQKRKIYESQSF